MKKIHIGLLPRIIIAIILGIAIGNFLPTPLVRLFVTCDRYGYTLYPLGQPDWIG